MKGFNLIEKGKLIIAMKKANVYQIKEIINISQTELERRKRAEKKGLKNA